MRKLEKLYKDYQRNAHKPPVKPIMGNGVLDVIDNHYKVPTCPSCDEPTYSMPTCPFCGQPFKGDE